jgi:hypothetical protein
VPFAARTLGATVTEHAMVVQRAAAALGRIERGIDAAQPRGLLKKLIAAYCAHRLAAKARGERFMGYAKARARLRAALATVAARNSRASIRMGATHFLMKTLPKGRYRDRRSAPFWSTIRLLPPIWWGLSFRQTG